MVIILTILIGVKTMGYEQESIEYKGHSIVIENDDNPQNPRTEWDNLTEIHCCSSRYYLGEHNHSNWDEFNEAVAEAKRQGDMVVDLYAYIHGGVALSIRSFHEAALPQGHAYFDSGKCGVVIIRREQYLKEFGRKKWSKKLQAKAYEYIKGDIETFNAYLNGEVYGYIVDDHEESCWGYYSVEEAMDEAKSVVDWMIQKAKKSHFEQLKTWIRNRVPLSVRQSMGEALAI